MNFKTQYKTGEAVLFYDILKRCFFPARIIKISVFVAYSGLPLYDIRIFMNDSRSTVGPVRTGIGVRQIAPLSEKSFQEILRVLYREDKK